MSDTVSAFLLVSTNPDQGHSPDLFQMKSQEWAYEKEWRILRVLSDATERIDRTPFPICLFAFPTECVKEIIVGMRADDSLVNDIRSIGTAFPQASLLRAHDHPTDYALIIR